MPLAACGDSAREEKTSVRREDRQEAGIVPKKTARAAEQGRPDVAERRSGWKARQSAFDTTRLVF
jgi:hypothetical protein